MRDILRLPVVLVMLSAAAGCGGGASLRSNPARIDFGEVYLGMRGTAAVTWTNIGSKPASVAGVDLGGAAFSQVSPLTAHDLAPNATGQTLVVGFTPRVPGVAGGKARPRLADGRAGPAVALRGQGVAQVAIGDLALSGGNLAPGRALDFGAVHPGGVARRYVVLENRGTGPLVVTPAVIGGGGGFRVPTAPLTIPPGRSLEITIEFRPSVAGTAAGAVIFSSGAAHRAGTALAGSGAL